MVGCNLTIYISLDLVFTFLVAGFNQELNFSCFSCFKANFKDDIFLLESKVSRLTVSAIHTPGHYLPKPRI